MKEYELSNHALEMLSERGISEEWLRSVIESADIEEVDEDGNVHYLKAIPEYDSRVLRVIVNPNTDPVRVITLFFDRRLRRLG